MNNSKVILKATNLTKVYPPDIWALDRVSLEIYDGEFVSIIGPSGCGKTTFLRIAAGLEDYQEGEVLFNGEKVFKNCDWRRSVIYQDIRLLPWMTAQENIYFGLENKGLPKDEVRRVGDKWMKIIGVDNFKDKYPHEISEGQKQMVGMARVCALDPDIVLCDEPTSSLDWHTRRYLQVELLKYWYNENKTVLFVTHDVEEAVYLSQRVVCMSARPGKIKEIIDIDLPKERWEVARDDLKVLEYANKVASILSEELKRGKELELKEGH
jgi:NitT/TauT family transport system ATP-binding protein